MNPITGTCHYSLGCTGYLSDCSSCPAVRGAFQRSVSLSLKRKTMALRKLTNLTVVAPSQWLADRASESSALRDVPVRVIPNPIRPIFCAPLDESAKASKYTFCVVAQNLVDPVKNVATAVGAFCELRKTYPHISLALVGNNGNHFSAEGVSALGTLSDKGIAETLSQSTAVIVPSLAENSPLVIAEAAARGAASLVNNVGGMPDMVPTLGAGHVFSHDAELKESMSAVVHSKTLGAPAARQNLSARAISLFSPTSVGQQYDDLYSV
jgi:glycosyltransferase involved in cell wall biosynthesis